MNKIAKRIAAIAAAGLLIGTGTASAATYSSYQTPITIKTNWIWSGTEIPNIISGNLYTVKTGDTLWKIATSHHTTVASLMKTNGLKSTTIFPGQFLLIPSNSNTPLKQGSAAAPVPVKPTTPTAPQPAPATPSKPTTSTSAQTYPQQVLDVLQMVNNERAKNGLSALTIDPLLQKDAMIKAQDMRDKHYFDHQSPTYGSPFDLMKSLGITYSYAGENIAAGQQTAQAVMNDWMNSSGHRANILNPNYTKIGIGYVTGGDFGTYWTQEFIRP
ncbi:CAP domain-containing protein [Effusibacillus dendaii]|uniref:LysM domain-containing protein n=1 Tax=Effusibacillus dendaii TaxID=2743772 RepID=A0A7I8DA58_9BACL|nr:CAP domain-containing protein [Effusibacillus dendaii]BCJ86242.1 hypothetical protein skT53_12270 [Effusibacillus dendaii]